jgi:hypothetical protein
MFKAIPNKIKPGKQHTGIIMAESKNSILFPTLIESYKLSLCGK